MVGCLRLGLAEVGQKGHPQANQNKLNHQLLELTSLVPC
jgi:hypothetical protein